MPATGRAGLFLKPIDQLDARHRHATSARRHCPGALSVSIMSMPGVDVDRLASRKSPRSAGCRHGDLRSGPNPFWWKKEFHYKDRPCMLWIFPEPILHRLNFRDYCRANARKPVLLPSCLSLNNLLAAPAFP